MCYPRTTAFELRHDVPNSFADNATAVLMGQSLESHAHNPRSLSLRILSMATSAKKVLVAIPWIEAQELPLSVQRFRSVPVPALRPRLFFSLV